MIAHNRTQTPTGTDSGEFELGFWGLRHSDQGILTVKKIHERIVKFIETEFQRVPALSTMGPDGIKSHFVDGKAWLKAFETQEERDFKDSFLQGNLGDRTIHRCLKTIKTAKQA